jgi:peptide chain release factor 2
MHTAIQLISLCEEKLASLEKMIPREQYEKRIDEIDAISSGDGFWNDQKTASGLMKERQNRHALLEQLGQFRTDLAFFAIVAKENTADVEEFRVDIETQLTNMSALELEQMMGDPADNTAAILSISAGAGGLEAANWVSMLLRMYLRYADAAGFKTELLDEKASEEHSAICLDSVSVRIAGPYAFGFLKGESGVHRLIRNSPFNSGGARHTSFAAVAVSPDIEDTIDIKIEEKDIEVTSQTAGGPGGQNSNRVCSAIRLKHLPTGINILVRTERDQLANKKTAFKMLKAKLYDIEIKKREAEEEKRIGAQQVAAFGSQIRSYTLAPFRLIKDERTGFRANDADKVLDGDIKDFLESYLRERSSK